MYCTYSTLSDHLQSAQTPRALAPLRVAAQGARSVHLVADAAQPSGAIPQSGSDSFALKLSPESFRSYRIDPPSNELHVTKDDLVHLYSEMVKMRRMEVAADQLYKHKLIRGFCHLSIGQVCAPASSETNLYRKRSPSV